MNTKNTTRRGFLGVTVLGATAALVHNGERSPLQPEGGLARDTAVERVLMATLWRVLLPRGAPAHSVEAAERALDEVARIEDVLSEFRPTSELSRVNASAGGAPVPVSRDTWTVVERSLDWARRSNGAFDPTWGALRPLWNFRENSTAPLAPPTREQVRALLPLVDWTAVEMDPRARTLRLARSGMALGLGGIAKGYALDRAQAVLRDAGVRDALLYAGGQVLVSGLRRGRPWRVGIQHPRSPESLFATVSLSEGSVSTGGDYEHSFEYEARRYHHILDPRTGFPVEHTVSLTVVTRSALEADALDTVLFVLPPERAIALARELDVAALHVGPSLQTQHTPAMRSYLELRTPLSSQT